ncbi:peptidyl-prolyl cis-trans isomerase [Candidatus Hepatincola sp. Av]
MSKTAIKNLIDEYIKEEVLYREALAMGLDKDDYIIKRRLVQKMQFMTEGVMEATSKVSSKEIENYFNQHQADYYIQPSVTFTHVFFSNEIHSKKLALALAKKQLKVLNNNKIPFADAPKYGDRFLYYVNYVDRTKDFVESHFATTMSNKLFQLKPSHHWYGPFQSPYGYHLVYISKHTLGRKAKLSEVIDKVTYDLQLKRNSQETNKVIKDIIKTYKVKVDMPALLGDNKLMDSHNQP